MNTIINFHIKHGYCAKIKPLTNTYGCFVIFPPNIFIHKPELNITYLIDNSFTFLEIYTLEHGKDILQNKITLPKIAIRTFILQNIILKLLNRKMSINLILIENKQATKNIFDILDLPMDEEDILFEKELFVKFRNLLLGKVEYDITNQIVKEGYQKLLESFEQEN